jgi:hypothetical protein
MQAALQLSVDDVPSNVSRDFAHQLGNLLQILSANLEFIRSDGPLTADQTAELSDAIGAAREAVALVRQVSPNGEPRRPAFHL